ncbi:MAG: hypothetical protein II649_09395 [Kiritimatiellae bacterium]|nr:hypothetical protein [Kiritimatiellia bacterium]
MTRLTKEKVLSLQKAIVKRFGGESKPPHDMAALDAALAAPFARTAEGDEAFPTRAEKAAKLCHELATKRVFGADGARMSMAVMLVFLEANGLSVVADPDDVTVTARALANRRLRYDDVLAWVCRHAR